MTAELGRFTIRDLAPWDAPELFKLTGDPEVMRYMGFRTQMFVRDAEKLIETYAANQSTRFQGIFLTEEPANLLGVTGLEIKEHQAAMTIMFARIWKARGAGREFSVPFVQWLFTHPQIWRVCAYCHVDNVPVQRVLRRMGAGLEGRLRRFEVFPNISNEPQDVFLYSIVR